MTALDLILGTPAYPRPLAAIKDPPEVLRVKGDPAALTRPCIAVVGSREASPVGLRAAKAIGLWCAEQGLAVVSGLALGIDAAAHEGALMGPLGRTVAVLAHGLDTVYPREHADLAARIAGDRGAVVSEYAERTRPAKVYFVRRNRLVTGLSLATVLVEAKAQSGSMTAVRFAREQGRPVFAVWSEAPGFEAGGADRAVREFGAVAVRSVGELADAIGPLVERARNDDKARAAARKG